MTQISDIVAWMESTAPLALSESWDNTGLLLGDAEASVSRLQTCLTLTPVSVAEAISKQAEMVIAHHPLPFKPLAKITTNSQAGRLVWDLARHGIAVYAPHTAWDSAPRGINTLLAQRLGLRNCQPLVPAEDPQHPELGAGRVGELSETLTIAEVAQRMQQEIPACRPRCVDAGRPIRRIAIACGSGGSLLPAARRQACDLFLTGEATFHTCLEAEAAEVSLLMVGHFASERFAMDVLAEQLADAFPSLNVWPSEDEQDPVRTLE